MSTDDFSNLATIQINNRSSAAISDVSIDGRLLIIDQNDNDKEFLSLLDVGLLRQKLMRLSLDWDANQIPSVATRKRIPVELVLVTSN